MKKTQKKWLIIVIIVLCFALAGILSWMMLSKPKATTSKTKKALYWVAPMNPGYRSDKSGKSPMGMDLVPVYADSANLPAGTIKISPTVVNNLGVRTAIVKKQTLSQVINTVGYVQPDENKIHSVNTYADGWVRELLVKAIGDPVKKGQLLLRLYSPEINNAQEEYLLALQYHNKLLINSGKQKLETLGMADKEIQHLTRTRKAENTVGIYAKQNGVVTKLIVREGMHVKPEMPLITIADLSHIWVIVEIYEQQSAWAKVGQKASVTFAYLPGKTYQGVVDYIYPELDPKTHTVRVRLSFLNPGLQLKPDMYGKVKIATGEKPNVLAVPEEAIIKTGEGDRVVMALGKGEFRPQPVKLGMESNDMVEVLSGLKPGDKVVTSSQFLLDSESNLKAGLSRLTAKPQNNKNKKSK